MSALVEKIARALCWDWIYRQWLEDGDIICDSDEEAECAPMFEERTERDWRLFVREAEAVAAALEGRPNPRTFAAKANEPVGAPSYASTLDLTAQTHAPRPNPPPHEEGEG